MRAFFLTMLIAVWPALAEPLEDAKDRSPYSQAELDQMVAPVALYPDGLLAQFLMAATYPLEIVQAARWSRQHPDLHGEEAVRAVAQFDWDPSVKSMVAFPRLLQMMDEKLEWTQRLGDAFLGQEYDLMRAVQQLRWRAYAAGNLRSSEELGVRLEGTDFSLEMPTPEVVYVPYYDADAVYSPGYGGIGFAVGIPVGAGFFFGRCDWAGRHVRFASYRPFYFRNVHRWQRGGLWRHDPDHRRGVAYRDVNARHQRESNPLVRVPQPGTGIPRAEVRAGGLSPMPPPLQAVPQSSHQQPSALARPVHAVPHAAPQAAPQAAEPSALARPSSVPAPSAPSPSAPSPSALARPEAPSPPPEGNSLRRR